MPEVPGSPLLLELDLTEAPVEPDSEDPLARLRYRNRRQLRPTLRALYEAGADPRVVGLIVKVGGALPYASMQQLRLGVTKFAASGKPTVAWAESFEGGVNLAAYTLATACAEVWLQPGGGIGPLGVGVETTFVRGTLDKLGVEPQIEQRHEYKNAADVLTRTEMTPAHQEALERLTASVFDDAVAEIAADRKLDAGRVRELIDAAPLLASEAREAGLVDRLGYRDEAYAALRARVPAKATLLFADRWHPRRRPHWPRRRQGHVALIQARGGIASGRNRRGAFGRQIGSDSVGAQLRAALADEQAKAVVMHVDSPGGSAVASEVIWREVSRVRDAGKPVIVSMGDVAASGGYYISCGADVIVALPATVTGSIGVLSGKFVTAGLMERLGLTTGTVAQGDRALMYSSRRRFDEDERANLAAPVDAIYSDFVGKVAYGRGRSFDEIEPLARGRVWTGRDALERGLVDQLGGLREAVDVARNRAGLRDDAPVVPAVHLPWFARLGRPRNSEDPRALATATLPGLSDLTSALGGLDAIALRMPPLRLR